MSVRIRLLATPSPEPRTVHLAVAFSISTEVDEAPAAQASIETGDGQSRDLGLLCAPTRFTWRQGRLVDLGTHCYAEPGRYTARLRWGGVTVETAVDTLQTGSQSPVSVPQLAIFAVREVADSPLQRAISVRVTGLRKGQAVRLDAGIGQIDILRGDGVTPQSAEWTANYPKPGAYHVALDLLDPEGFWLTTIAESPLEIVATNKTFEVADNAAADAPAAAARSAVRAAASPVASVAPEPWLPYRYARPAWSGVRTYTQAGGGQIMRVISWGTYLSIRAEAAIGDEIWYQTGSGDWVASSELTFFQPSELRGLDYSGTPPAPPPVTPPPTPEPVPPEVVIAKGVVTATVLNVRARAGVSADNPPVGSLEYGHSVDVYEKTMRDGAEWYRIGVNRWVAGSYVKLSTGATDPTPSESRSGVVIAAALNVRRRPGVNSDNAPIDVLMEGTPVTIYSEAVNAGATWYRIGEDRWVHGAYVQLNGGSRAIVSNGAKTGQGTVVAAALNVRTAPGLRPNNPPISELRLGEQVVVYETRSYGGTEWHRIGSDRWVLGDWVRIDGRGARYVAGRAGTRSAADKTLDLPIGWVVADKLEVRARPGLASGNDPINELTHYQVVSIEDEQTIDGEKWYRIGASQWVSGLWIGVARRKARPSSIAADARWVGVSLQEQTLVCYEGDTPVYAALVATGMAGTPTVQGIFSTWRRLPTGKMVGGSPASGSYYYIEDVTWTCYFYSGYSLHTAYWHDSFGRPRSHGCVNLSPYDAWWIYEWSAPGGDNSPTVYVYWA